MPAGISRPVLLARRNVPVAQWIEQARPKRKIGSSTLPGDASQTIGVYAENLNANFQYSTLRSGELLAPQSFLGVLHTAIVVTPHKITSNTFLTKRT